MPRRLPPHVNKQITKGKSYFYFRVGKGPRAPLPGAVGSPEFEEAYSTALAGCVAARAARRVPETAGTIAALITSYKGGLKYLKLRSTTKVAYARRLDFLKREHGHRTVAGLTAARIEKAILLPLVDRPGESLNILKLLRILIKHARYINWLTSDPSVGIDRPKSTEVRSWTDEEIAAFEARWPIGTKQRLAFALQLYTGQRISDVHRMTWADVNGGTIRVVQVKTENKLKIALHRDLRRVLDVAERRHVTILTTEYDKPFTVAGYGNWLRDAIRKAGLPLSARPHGLRKAAGRRLADAQCSPHEIMAVLGLKTLSEAERYTREADQPRLSSSGITKLEERQTRNRDAQTASEQFGKSPKIQGDVK